MRQQCRIRIGAALRNDAGKLMSIHALGPEDGLYYEHRPPPAERGLTFVFFNALTGDAAGWDALIGPALRDAGHGTLLWNYRGQTGSPFSPDVPITAAEIVADAQALLAALEPSRPVFVGLSIGGLFAARAHLGGSVCLGMLLINTLRKGGTRLDWLNEALTRCALTGGLDLVRDLYLPLLAGPRWLAANRAGFLKDQPYAPLPPESGAAKLLAASATADWEVPWEQIRVPVIVLTGLQDRVFYDPVDVAELAARLPEAERIDLPEVGHLIPVERPEPVVDACLALARWVG